MNTLNLLNNWFSNYEYENDFSPKVNLGEDKSNYFASIELPGVKKEDIEINYDNGILTIIAETKKEVSDSYHYQESYIGKYSRSIKVGKDIKADKITASLEDGILKVQLPIAESQKTKKITVK